MDLVKMASTLFRSNYPDIAYPDENVVEFLFKNADKYADNVAFHEDDTGREITYAEFRSTVERIAKNLLKRGVKRGDVVCLFAVENIDWILTAFAVGYIGATFTGCNRTYPEEELQNHIDMVDPLYLFCSPELTKMGLSVAAKYGKFKELFVYGTDPVEGFELFSALIENVQDFDIKPSDLASSSDIFSISFSSGTTGSPKGIMHRHKSFVANIRMICSGERDRFANKEPVGLSDPPLLHVAGQLITMTFPFYKGAKAILITMYTDIDLKLKRLLSAITKHKVTMIGLLPHIGILLSKHPLVDDTDFSCVQSISMMGAPITINQQKQIIERLPKHIHVGQMYGLTEVHFTTVTPLTTTFPLGSCGKILPNVVYKLLDVGTKQIITKIGEPGELLFKTPSFFAGYLKRPDLTAEAIDEDGFFQTGDIGYFDDDGYLYVVDRSKDVMFYNGSSIWPSDLEDLIRTHPDVMDVGVVGIPHPPDDLPKAFVVKKTDSTLTEDDVIEYVKARTSKERWLRGGVEFIESIPRTGSGKIKRRLLRN